MKQQQTGGRCRGAEAGQRQHRREKAERGEATLKWRRRGWRSAAGKAGEDASIVFGSVLARKGGRERARGQGINAGIRRIEDYTAPLVSEQADIPRAPTPRQ
ncbi:hypothetical protein K438DRAFT_1805357 [Mycena galopus ATCC 62051]|nr:hypothetical protein K438DRAFT_1805357 [Mycena galopus ATCC 62051]